MDFFGRRLAWHYILTRKAPRSNPHPTPTCCMQNEVPMVIICLNGRRKKNPCVLTNLYVQIGLGYALIFSQLAKFSMFNLYIK